jgi:hypothetical protein
MSPRALSGVVFWQGGSRNHWKICVCRSRIKAAHERRRRPYNPNRTGRARQLLEQDSDAELLWHAQNRMSASLSLATREQARQVVFEYIELFYHRIRRHAKIGSKFLADFAIQDHAARQCPESSTR